MAASLLFCVVVVISTLSFVAVIETAKCPDKGNAKVEIHVDGRCFFAEPLPTPNSAGVKWAEEECRKLDEGPFKWYLPKVDTRAKRDQTLRMLGVSVKAWWIGLERDVPLTSDESYNVDKKWADKSKWRWKIDNTTMEKSFENEASPWNSGEPNNARGTLDLSLMERCVMAHKHTNGYWNDLRCQGRGIADALLCESTEMITTTSTTTTTTTTTTPTTTTTTTPTTSTSTTKKSTTRPTTTATSKVQAGTAESNSKKESSLHWILIGTAFAIAVVVAAVVGGLWYRKRRSEKNVVLKSVFTETTRMDSCSDMSGIYENVPNKKFPKTAKKSLRKSIAKKPAIASKRISKSILAKASPKAPAISTNASAIPAISAKSPTTPPKASSILAKVKGKSIGK